jgi:hypothetical protein
MMVCVYNVNTGVFDFHVCSLYQLGLSQSVVVQSTGTGSIHSQLPSVTVTNFLPSVQPERSSLFSIPHENPKYTSAPPKIRVITSHNAKFLIRQKDSPSPVLAEFPLDPWPTHLVPTTSHPNLPPLIRKLPLTTPIKPSTDSFIYFGTNSLEVRQRLWDGQMPMAHANDVIMERWGKLSFTFWEPSKATLVLSY